MSFTLFELLSDFLNHEKKQYVLISVTTFVGFSADTRLCQPSLTVRINKVMKLVIHILLIRDYQSIMNTRINLRYHLGCGLSQDSRWFLCGRLQWGCTYFNSFLNRLQDYQNFYDSNQI